MRVRPFTGASVNSASTPCSPPVPGALMVEVVVRVVSTPFDSYGRLKSTWMFL
jgi:hypothetical protein